jgi:hypothetical protein
VAFYICAINVNTENNLLKQMKAQAIKTQVYNLTDDANFDPGIYVWEGAQWKPVTPASPASVGDLTKATTLGLGASHTPGLSGTCPCRHN